VGKRGPTCSEKDSRSHGRGEKLEDSCWEEAVSSNGESALRLRSCCLEGRRKSCPSSKEGGARRSLKRRVSYRIKERAQLKGKKSCETPKALFVENKKKHGGLQRMGERQLPKGSRLPTARKGGSQLSATRIGGVNRFRKRYCQGRFRQI